MMKIFKTAFVCSVLAISVSAFASSPQTDDGREEALKFCQTLTFESNVRGCMQGVEQSRYFDVRALDICGTMSFESAKTQCIGEIANKDFLDGEIAICGKEQFDSGKMSCLASAGQGHASAPGAIDVPAVADRLAYALDALRHGNPAVTDRVLVDVLNYLESKDPAKHLQH